MKCVIPGVNVKILAKAIHALARIGDEMYIEPQETGISFRTVNMANSAYADFTMFQNYFSCYEYGDLQKNDALKCKISMRSAMTVFKAPNVIDKQVETCHIRLQPDASEIFFILKYKNSITKTHLLPILDCEVLQTAYDKNSASNQLSSQPRVLGDAVHNFHQTLIEITMEVSSQKLLLRNYIDETSGLSNTTRTQLVLGKGEFDQYNINKDTSITFCMKEFKAILSLAEVIGIPIGIYFVEAGRPVIFALKNPSLEANLVLSTLNSDADSQTETTVIGKQDKSVKQRTRNTRVPRKSSKSTNRIGNRSTNMNKTSENATAKNTHSNLIEKNSNLICKEKVDVQPSVSGTSRRNDQRNDQSKNGDSCLLGKQNTERESHNDGSSSHNVAGLSKTPTNGKKLVNSIFSSITKRKSSNDEIDRQQGQNNDKSNVLEDEVPDSPTPPVKKARLIFQKCFQKTFDPRTLPGYDIILAEDSDEGCSE
ncbi:cell cycle checkpoint control protein RAD9A isoform X1 [Hylaeus anthracinus]|uniref:cell cycle checkpoint control protein RAD9A isoform X1 n=2 Tax=Hylaeus anthracinus TaxID=313031 RepID=UPI0023B8F875|nr:cell cycle checkpoint control protein RAD9A isoform X1 [Hylaeus anthracinus]